MHKALRVRTVPAGSMGLRFAGRLHDPESRLQWQSQMTPGVHGANGNARALWPQQLDVQHE
eukprot:scaffold208394_cov22-Tisochrysis_lutea.AAC.5